MSDDRIKYLEEIAALRTATNAVFQGHDGMAIMAICAEYTAKWIMANPKHMRMECMRYWNELMMELIFVAATVEGDPDPLGEGNGHGHRSH